MSLGSSTFKGAFRRSMSHDKRVVLEPSSERGCAAFNLQSYRSLYAVLERHFSLGVIGCEFIERPEQVRGWVPPEWRPFRTDVGWLTTDVAQTWSEISHSAFRINKIVVAQQARHIAAQLRICSFRLRDLSRSYNNHLRVLVDSGNFKKIESDSLAALQYRESWYLALFRLSEFARDAVSLSPVAPTPILITDKDVIRGSIKYG